MGGEASEILPPGGLRAVLKFDLNRGVLIISAPLAGVVRLYSRTDGTCRASTGQQGLSGRREGRGRGGFGDCGPGVYRAGGAFGVREVDDASDGGGARRDLKRDDSDRGAGGE